MRGIPAPLSNLGRLETSGVDFIANYRHDFDALGGFSIDLGYESTSERIANAANTLVIPPRWVWSAGGRYRFDLIDKPATFRAQLASVNNVFGYNNLGEGFYYNPPRRFQMSLTVDM